MRTSYPTVLLAAVCGWLPAVSSAPAQLTREWSYNLSTLGLLATNAPTPVIVDDSGNTFVLTYVEPYISGFRITKIKPDSTIDWQIVSPDTGLGLVFFTRTDAGDLYVGGLHEMPGGWTSSIVGKRFDQDGNLLWAQKIAPPAGPYFSLIDPMFTVDVDGNLWAGITEQLPDTICVDSLPYGWGTKYQGVFRRMDASTGAVTEIDRIEVEPLQSSFVGAMKATKDGLVHVIVGIGEYCCNSLCQGCNDSCFTQYYGLPTISRSTQYLRHYTTSGSYAGAAWLTASDNEYYSARLVTSRTGNLYTVTHRYMSPPPYWTYLSRFGSWTLPFAGETIDADRVLFDFSDDLYSIAYNEQAGIATVRLIDGTTGSVHYTQNTRWGTIGVARDGSLLLKEYSNILHKYDRSGNEQWTYNPGYDMGNYVYADTTDCLYYLNYRTLFKLRASKDIVIRDARRDSIPNVNFDLIKVTNNPPYFDEDTLGSFTTDSEGRLGLTPIAPDSFFVQLDLTGDTLVVGDSLKIAKHVQSVPAVKHQALLGTMYSVHLDNMQFAENGQVFFDTLTSGDQDIVLDRTDLRYNLLVSVEWEATDAYLRSLEDNFRYMSNYLYDVSDGQIRLDTVLIFDNDYFSWEADVLIMASNMEWPRADAGGILRNGIDYLYMPRIWMGDSTKTRNHTDAVYPLDLTNPSDDYRTKAHEFGHYALNFYDEYLFWHPDSNLYSPNDVLRCLSPTVFRYGFMDYQYEGVSEMSSEMSGAFRYNMESCRNTNQWLVHNKSCWDHLESWVEVVPWGADNLFIPILKPDLLDTLERVVTNPAVFFAGPNNDLNNLDYDVGIMVHFPNQILPQAVGYSNKHVTVHHSTGGDNANIELKNNPGAGAPDERVIRQGRSSDAARAWVVGVKDAAYQILASKGNSLGTVTEFPLLASPRSVTTGWLYGMAESGGSGVSRVGNRYVANSAEDSITIELNEVQGYYPLISKATLTADGTVYDITSTQSFPSDPTLELWPSYGGSYNQSVSLSGSGYSAAVSDSLGESGSFTLWASDDSSRTFFVPNAYTTAGVSHDQAFIWLFGAEGKCEFKVDSANTSLARAIILSSHYPVIRTGLDKNAVQAGQTQCLSVYPDNPLIGFNQIVLRYDDADLKLGELYLGNEATLAVYHWVDAVTGWALIGGTVDTIQNTIYTSIAQTGVYAAFTKDIITDVEENEHGNILPYRFELSQNYPNPFNPVTTIEYSLPERSHVTIEVYNILGQRVQTLVDREESAGSHTITWDGTSFSGQPVSTGVYVYRFQAEEYIETKKMLLLK